jgi:hypothetical protein
MCLLDKVTTKFGPPLPPGGREGAEGGEGGRGARLPYCCNIVVIFCFDCGTNLLLTFGKFSFSLPVTVSTSTYVTHGGALFYKMFSPGPSKHKGW